MKPAKRFNAPLVGAGLGGLVAIVLVPVVVAALYMEHRTRTSAPIPIAIASQVR